MTVKRKRKRTPRPWWKKPFAQNLAQSAVMVLCVGVFLRLTVNSFDSDEIRELGAVAAAAMTVLRLWQGK